MARLSSAELSCRKLTTFMGKLPNLGKAMLLLFSKITKYHTERFLLVCLIAFKIAMIIVYAPLIQNDTHSYVSFAQHILASILWSADRSNSLGSDSFRMIGYPALIAAAQALFGTGWGYAVVAFQTLIGLVAIIRLHHFVYRVMNLWWAGIVVAGSYALSHAFVYELHVLTDGIYGHLLVLATILLADQIVERSRKITVFIFSGSLLAGAFLLREFTLFLLLPIFGPVTLLAAWRAGNSHGARAIRFTIVMLPVFVLATTYASWNEARTGTRFITTGARTAALLPLVQLQGYGLPVFDGDTVLDEAAHANLEDYFFADVLAINRDLMDRGLTGARMSELARTRYIDTLMTHPLAFAGLAVRNVVTLARLKNLGNPLWSLRAVQAFHEGHAPPNIRIWALAAFESGVPLHIGAAVVEGLLVLLSAIVMLAYLLFPVVYVTRLKRRSQTPAVWHMFASLWVGYCGAAFIYGLVRLEDRYLIGFVPFLVFIGLFVMLTLFESFRRNRRRPAP